MEPVFERARRQRILLIVFFVVCSITFSILYFGYFKKEKEIILSPPPSPVKEIKIDFSIFESPILKELQPLERIESPKPEEIGRENPFSPIK